MRRSQSALSVRILTKAGGWGGTEVHVLQLAHTLADRGHDVAILELGTPVYSRAGSALDPRVRVMDLSPQRSPAPRRAGQRDALAALRREMSCDVCVLVKGGIEHGSWRLDVEIRARASRYVTIEHLACPMPARTRARHLAGLVPGAALWWHRQWLRRAFRGVFPHTVICVSEAVRRELRDTYRVPAGKLVAVPNGIDLERFQRSDSARRAMRFAWGISQQTLVFGSIGRLSPVKGCEVAVRAFAQLRRRRPDLDARLVMAGDGPDREALIRLAHDTGVAEDVLFPGFTTTPEDVLSALDVFVMPSRAEGLPLALLEAMACECCPVATAVGGVPEVLPDRSFGWLVPPDDEDAFTAAVRDVGEMPAAKRAAIGRRGRDRVRREFDGRRQFARVADAIEGREWHACA